MIRFALMIAVTGSICACSSPEDVDERLMVAQTSASSASTSASASGANSSATATSRTSEGGLSVSVENDQYQFEYSFGGEAGSEPKLREILEARLDAAQDEVKSQSAEAKQDAATNDYPFRQHFLEVNWQVVADLPQMLSLSANIASYSGGAHGNSGFDGLVWDRKNAKALKMADFFVSEKAMSAALAPSYCPALNKIRSEKRGIPVDPNSGDSFDTCPKMSELTILPGSSNGKTFNRIGLLAGPYVAGSYAEGPYEVTVPMNAAIMAAVKPAYAEFFSSGQ
ncbi:MAG: DUF4163 domain-containing protein [Erythrobacter sp.]